MSKINWPKVDKFLSPAEIVDELFDKMKDADNVDEFVKNGSGMYHHGMGTWIRNEYHLWHPENPYTMKDYIPELKDGVDYNPRHADNMSGDILRKLHGKISEYHSNKIR